MCPDDQTLSRFFDGEVDPQTAIQLKKHITECFDCRNKLNSYGELRNILTENNTPWMDTAVEEVFSRIQRDTRLYRKPLFWKRWVMIPAPVVAVAVAGICVLFATLFITTGIKSGNPIVLKQQGAMQLEMDELQLQDLHQFFDSQDFMIEAQMDIPSDGGFTIIGEPQLLRVGNDNRRR
jgi:hypothetical protein